MLVKDVMTKNVITIDSNQTILDAYKKYRDNKVGSLVVTDSEKCIGIVTERDLIEKAIDKDLKTTLVKDIMTSNVRTISPSENLDTASELMEKYNIKKLPVLYDDNITGIITINDIVHTKPELTKRYIETWIKARWK
ncbi:MAG: CBS domain-containing protein [Thermoplasmatales archaeon]|nr:MAG: CBS domain-containing protein [Thermoplasmatales archaeon]